MFRGLEARPERYTLSQDDCKTVYIVGFEGPRKLKNADIVNLSESGALFRVSDPIPLQIDDQFLLEFKVPGLPETIVWKGRVVRFQWTPAGMEIGIQFLNLPRIFITSIRKGLSRKRREERVERAVSEFVSAPQLHHLRDWSLLILLGVVVTASVCYMVMNPQTFQDINQMNIYGKGSTSRDISSQK